MDDVMVRSRYPRRSVPRKRRRLPGERRSLAKIIARQTAVCLILLLIAGTVRIIDTPFTNYITDKVRLMLAGNVEISSVFKYLENAGLSIRNSIFPDQTADQSATDARNGQGSGIQPSDGRLSDDQSSGSQSTGGQSIGSQANDGQPQAGQTNGGQPQAGQTNGSQPQAGQTKDGQLSNIQPADSSSLDANSETAAPGLKQETSVLGVSTEDMFDYSTGMIAPVPGVLSSGFGERTDPASKAVKVHEGIDIATDNGASVVAVLGGKVAETGSSPSYGNYIKIKHNEIYTTVYAHCSAIKAVEGQNVLKGDTIAKVGETGAAVGVHLHFEIWRNGVAVDPLEYISIPQK